MRRSCPTDSPPRHSTLSSASPWLQSPHPPYHLPCPVESGGRGALSHSVPSRRQGQWGLGPHSTALSPRAERGSPRTPTPCDCLSHLIFPSPVAANSDFNRDSFNPHGISHFLEELCSYRPSEKTRRESGQGLVQNSASNSEVSTGPSAGSQAPDGRSPEGVTESNRDLSYS